MDKSDLEQRLAKLQKQFHGLRIMGGEGVTVHGSPAHGYAVEIKAGAADSSGAGGGGGGGGPTPTGACCIGGVCHILTAADCATMGGIYQGDGIACSPNPCGCPPFGTDPIFVAIAGVTLCPCQDTGGGTSFLGEDGHFPGNVPPGINSDYTVPAGGPGWQAFLDNSVGTDPFFYEQDWASSGSCAGDPTGFDVSQVVINISCTGDGIFTVAILHGGRYAFNGTGTSPVTNSLTDLSFCDGSGANVGFGGTAAISW